MDDVVHAAAGVVVLLGLACLATMVVSLAGIVVWGCYNIVTGKWVN